MKRPAILVALALSLAVPAQATPAGVPADPLGSPMWAFHAARLFAGHRIVFDPVVRVHVPQIAENQHVFPVTVDARALPEVQRIVLLADLDPIPVAVDYAPVAAAPFLATRIKLDQRTPVRAAVLTRDGTWHLAGTWVDAAGGGCSAPPFSRVRGDWADHLGEVRGAAWHEAAGLVRVRVSIRHPMDTGLVENIPAYNIERVTVRAADGTVLGAMQVFGSVAEDPAFTLVVQDGAGGMQVSARDSAGLEFAGRIDADAIRAANR
ncbi:MAG: hypothetical protein RIS94_1643 [Pseudomonadota bacterium]|jgi:sulfur-oxidizing protein SoxY